MNVFEYFQIRLSADPRDATLAELYMNTPCGADCRAAIDAAASLIAHVHATVGKETIESAWIIEATDVVCRVYWRG